jgi:hypothetical protein
MDDLNKKIYGKIVVLLNTFGYNKKNLSNIKKDELKPILKEVYNEFGTLGNLSESQNGIWQNAIEEIMYEKKVKEEKKLKKKESSENLLKFEEIKEDKLNSEDYDDLIQPEFPSEYIESIHSQKIAKLSEQLENERKYELSLRNDFISKIKKADEEFDDKKDKLKGYPESEQQTKTNEYKEERDKSIKESKRIMKKMIKDNKCMKNDEFLLLLCLMRKKKEQMYENNPYFVDFSVTLDSVYQTKMGEDVQNRKNELFRFDDFETDLSKYVD